MHLKSHQTAFMTAFLILALSLTTYAVPADYIFTGGKIYTMNDKEPEAEAIAVEGKKIVYVGDAAEVKKLAGEGTKQVDLKGRVLLSGFISAHDHLIASNWTNMGVNLFDARSKGEALNLIKEFAEANPDDKVIRGIGWSRETFGGELPTAELLDTVVPDRPAFLLDFEG